MKPLLLKQQLYTSITSQLSWCSTLKVMLVCCCCSSSNNIYQHDHAPPALASLHEVPIASGIHFKILLFASKSLNSLGPPSLSGLSQADRCPHSPGSADQWLLQSCRMTCTCQSDRLRPPQIRKPILEHSFTPWYHANSCFSSWLCRNYDYITLHMWHFISRSMQK